jgi:ribosomal protein S11
MTDEDLKYLFTERVGIMMFDGNKTESEAAAQAIYEVREVLVKTGMDFPAANLKVMAIKRACENS